MKAIHAILVFGCAWPLAAQEPTQDRERLEQQERERLEREHMEQSRQAFPTGMQGTIDLRKGETVIGADIRRSVTGAVPREQEGLERERIGEMEADEKLGEVENLIVRANDGTIAYVVVSLDEGLDTGDKLFAMPFEVLRPLASTDPDRLQFSLGVDAERLRAAPSFDEDNWPDLTNLDSFRQVDDFFRDSVRNLPEITRRDPVGTQPAGARMEQAVLLRFEKVKGCNVDTSGGEDAGEIEELAVDVRNGTIAFALLSTGGFLGLGEDHHAVPWKALSFTAKKEDPDDPDDKEIDLTCRLTIPESKLENAPEYDGSDWRKVNDPSFLERIYTHYGMAPYWARSGAATQDPARTNDPERKQGDR